MTKVSVSVGRGGRYVPITFIIMGLCTIAVALFFTYDTFNKMENWVEVEGTVVYAKAVKSSWSTQSGDMYRVEVTYQYEFGGETYKSTISPGVESNSKAAKMEEAASYVIGSTRKLSVNPSKPQEISHILGYNLETFLLPLCLGGGGLFFALLGILTRKLLLVSLKGNIIQPLC